MTLGWGLLVKPAAESCSPIWLPRLIWDPCSWLEESGCVGDKITDKFSFNPNLWVLCFKCKQKPVQWCVNWQVLSQSINVDVARIGLIGTCIAMGNKDLDSVYKITSVSHRHGISVYTKNTIRLEYGHGLDLSVKYFFNIFWHRILDMKLLNVGYEIGTKHICFRGLGFDTKPVNERNQQGPPLTCTNMKPVTDGNQQEVKLTL